MDATTLMSTPPEQVDNLIKMVADEHGLNLKDTMDAPSMANPAAQAPEKGTHPLSLSYLTHLTTSFTFLFIVANPADELEQRLAALRR